MTPRPRCVRRAHRAHRALAAVLATAVLLSGCTGLPESGPVLDAGARSSVDQDRASDINVVPPTPGMTASAVVNGFLDAVTASPTRVDIAKQFLTVAAATEWEPEAGTITYSDRQQPRDERRHVSVRLIGAERLDRSGAFVGRLSGSESTLQLDLAVEDGEYRIEDPPDALVVPRSWFNQRYRAASLYYFDPSGRILVPQPVYVQRGDQLASNLVSRLIQGPGPELGRLTRSYLPTGLDPRVSVDVTVDGVAEVDLGGESGPISAAASERLLAQLAWTLRQQPAVRSLRVRVGGAAVRGPDGEEVYQIDEADPYDTNGPRPSLDLYAVQDGRLAVGNGNELDPVEGPFGDDVAVRAGAPNIDGTRAAVVGLQGRSMLLAELAEEVDGEPTRARLVVRGTDLLTPGWDFADRIWVVDRTAAGAVVHVVDGGDRVIDVSGVSGADVRSFLVSRDGTRFVAVVRRADRDELRVGRVETNELGAVVGIRSTRQIEVDPGLDVLIDDIAWTSPTTLALLTPIESDRIYEVRTIGVDGSPSSAESLPTRVVGPVLGLAGSPVTDLPTFVVTPDNRVDLTDDATFGFLGSSVTGIVYAG